MYKIKNKLEVVDTVGIIFILGGLLFLVILLFVSINTNKKLNSLSGETEMIGYEKSCKTDDDGTYCSPIFEYEVDGQVYKCGSSVSSTTMSFDKYKKIYYDPKNPSDCLSEYEVKGSQFFSFFTIIPAIFILVGGGMLFKTIMRMIKISKLKKVGVLYKNLPYTMSSSGVTVNGRNVLCIEVEFTFPNGVKQILRSRPVYSGQTGDADGMVDVLIDPNDNSNYYIDFNIEQKY